MSKVLEEFQKNGLLIRDSNNIDQNIGKNHTVPGTLVLPGVAMRLFSQISSGVIISTNVKVEHAYKGDVNSFTLTHLPPDSEKFIRPENMKDLKTVAALKEKIYEMERRRTGPHSADINSHGRQRVLKTKKLPEGQTYLSRPYSGRSDLAHNEVLMHLEDSSPIIGIHLCLTDKEAIRNAFAIEDKLSDKFGLFDLEYVTYDTHAGIRLVREMALLKKIDRELAVDCLFAANQENNTINFKYEPFLEFLRFRPLDFLLKHELSKSNVEQIIPFFTKNGIELYSILQSAVRIGNIDFVDKLLKNNDFTDEQKRDLLNMATFHNQGEIVKLFLNSGVNTNIPDTSNRIPLDYAKENPLIHNLIPLGQAKSNPGMKSILHQRMLETSFQYAVENEAWEQAQKIVESQDFDVNNTQDKNLDTPLHALGQNPHLPLTNTLLQSSKIDIFKLNIDGATALQLALEFKNDAMVDAILNYPQFDFTKLNGNELKHFLKNGNNVINKFLSSCNEKANLSLSPSLANALHQAVKNGHTELIDFLLEKGKVDINHQNQYGATALCYAAQKENAEMVAYLLEKENVRLDIPDKTQKTALHYAVKNSDLCTVKLLLTHADNGYDIMDAKGKKPIDYADSRDETGKQIISILKTYSYRNAVQDFKKEGTPSTANESIKSPYGSKL